MRANARRIFLAAIAVIFVFAAYKSISQYHAWSYDVFGRFLLPPYRSIGYFITFSLVKFFAPYLISLAFSSIFLFAAARMNTARGDMLFEEEEPYLGALSIFLTGHPGWIFYIITLITFYLFLHTTYYILLTTHLHTDKNHRIPLYYIWVPIAIFVILISEYWLAGTSPWLMLKISG